MTSPQYPPAGLLRRLAAMVYDSLLVMSLAMLYGGLFIALKHWILGIELAPGEKARMGSTGFIGLLLVVEIFFWFFWCKGGQTLGMKAWRLQLLDDRGGAVRLPQAVRRGLLAPLSLLLLGIGYLWCLWDRDGQTWHDHISGTRVVVLPKPKR